MGNHVFISYSAKDKALAEAACTALERGGFRCWVAHRDARPGENYGEEIIRAINASWLFVLIFTRNANRSQFVASEVERAFARRVRILKIRLADIDPSERLELFIAAGHWLSAEVPLSREHLDELVKRVRELHAQPPPERTTETEIAIPPRPNVPEAPVPPGPPVPEPALLGSRMRRSTIVAAAFLLIAIGVIGALNMNRDVMNPGDVPVAPLTLTLTLDADSLFVGDTFTVRAQLGDDTVGAQPDVRWSSSNAGVVDVAAGAQPFRALSAGTVVVYGETADLRDSVIVTVLPVRIASLRIREPTALRVGESITLTAVAQNRAGAPIASGELSWSTENARIASIDAKTGVMTGVGAGRTKVTVQAGAVADTVPITVATAPTRPPVTQPGQQPALTQEIQRTPVTQEVPRPLVDTAQRNTTPTATAAETRDALSRMVETCMGFLTSRDTARVRANYRPVTARDSANLARLISLIGRRGYRADDETPYAPNTSDASIAFSVSLYYRNNFGTSSSVRPKFGIETTRTTAGTLRMSSCRVIEGPLNIPG